MGEHTEILLTQTKKDLSDLGEEMGMAIGKGWSKADLVGHLEDHIAQNDDDEEVQEMFTGFVDSLTDDDGEPVKAKTSTAGKLRPLPTRGAGEIIVAGIKEYVEAGEAIDEAEIIASVKNAYPNQNPDTKAIAYYKTLLRNNGYEVPKGKSGRPAEEQAAA